MKLYGTIPDSFGEAMAQVATRILIALFIIIGVGILLVAVGIALHKTGSKQIVKNTGKGLIAIGGIILLLLLLYLIICIFSF